MSHTFDNRPPQAWPQRMFGAGGYTPAAAFTGTSGASHEFTVRFTGAFRQLQPYIGADFTFRRNGTIVPATTRLTPGDTARIEHDSTGLVDQFVADYIEFEEVLDFAPQTAAAPVLVIPHDPPPAWAECRVATTANVDLSSALEAGDTLNGVTLAAGDRVLVRAQTSAAQNGICTAPASGAASRAADANESAEFVTGRTLFVREGGSLAGTYHGYSGVTRPTLGSTAITFAAVPPPAAMTP